jgi:hypothetical protein
MLINGVAYAVDQGSTMDYLVERVTKSIQNILAGHNDMMVGYLDSTPSYDADGKKQLSFYPVCEAKAPAFMPGMKRA